MVKRGSACWPVAVKRFLQIVLFTFLSTLACAQQETEIISLRHRTLDQVLPALQPLLEPGGALTGMNDQLIVRASRGNREQIRQALAAIDTPARRLLIRVSQNREAQSRQQSAELVGRVTSGETKTELRRGEATVTARANDWQGTQAIAGTQTIQVVEGGRALIRVGQSLPLPFRQVTTGPRGMVVNEGVVYRDLGQGFYATPRVVGKRVTVDISPQFDTPGDRGYGSVNTQHLSTTVSGYLGEWLELGGVNQQADSGQSRERRSVWLQVEELP